MKKFIIVFTSCVLAFIAFFIAAYLYFNGFFKSDDDVEDLVPKPRELHFEGIVPSYGVDGWNEVFEAFEKRENVKIIATFDNNISDSVKRDLEYGAVADVLYLPLGSSDGLTENMLNDRVIEDISDVMDMYVPSENIKVRDKIIPGFIDNYNTNPYRDSRVFLAPIFYSPCGFFYNRDLFDSGKYSLPESFDELFALGDSLDSMSLISYPDSSYFESFLPSVLCSVGGEKFYQRVMDYNLKAWSSDDTLRAFRIFYKLLSYVDDSVVKNAREADGFYNNQMAILDGRALFIPCGSWLPRQMSSVTPRDFNWGFMPFPSASSGGKRFSYAYFEQVFIPSASVNKDLAKKFIAFLYSDEAAAIFYKDGGAMQPIVGCEKFVDNLIDRDVFSVFSSGEARVVIGGFSPYYYSDGADIISSVYGNVDNIVLGDLSFSSWMNLIFNDVKKINRSMKR